jgi:GNAT superfamily N-acetyltransferase
MVAERAARRAEPSDRARVAEIIAGAFADDPLWGWALARPDGRTDHVAAYWRLFLEGPLRYPDTWITTAGTATAVWIPPGGTELTPEIEARVAAFIAEHLGAKATLFFDLEARFDEAHPRGVEHYYLSLLGTHPDHRGNGAGMALLRETLEVIDAEHAPAYLESSNPANNDRYASVGFEAIGAFMAPEDGPLVTTMWRAAR